VNAALLRPNGGHVIAAPLFLNTCDRDHWAQLPAPDVRL